MSDTIARALALSNRLQFESGKSYRAVTGILRNSGPGNDWVAFTDGTHKEISIESVVADTTKIRVTYTFTGKYVVFNSTNPDETLVGQGINVGSSVGAHYADIYMYAGPVSGYVSYNAGTGLWEVLSSSQGIISASFSGNRLTITHESISGNSAGASSSCRDGIYLTSIGSVGSTYTEVRLFDYLGNAITSPDANMKIFLLRGSNRQIVPSTYINAGANIWFNVILEI